MWASGSKNLMSHPDKDAVCIGIAMIKIRQLSYLYNGNCYTWKDRLDIETGPMPWSQGALCQPYLPSNRALFQYEDNLSSYMESHYKHRWSWVCLIFIIGIPILVSQHLCHASKQQDCFNIRNFYCKRKIITWPSCLYKHGFYIAKTKSLYWHRLKPYSPATRE